MTALAILQLVNNGQLTLDTPVHTILPQFAGWGSAVTVRHLIWHTSGVPDYYESIEEEYERPTNEDALTYLASIARLDFTPGSRFEYSNSGYDVLGAIIEKVSGLTFPVYVETALFKPAQMKNSFAFSESRRKRSKRALGYAKKGRIYSLDDTSPLNDIHGSGSIYSTVEDLARYDKALFSGKFVPLSLLSEVFRSGSLSDGTPTDYGFGWELGTDEGVAYYGHSGAWMGFSTYYLHYPAEQLSVVVLSNYAETDGETLAFKIAALVN